MRATPLKKGDTFGRWTVLGPSGRKRGRALLWQVECACGRLAERTSTDLRKSNSCGCLRGERLAERNRMGLTPAAVGVPRVARPKAARPCAWCGAEFQPKRESARWCSPACKARARWAQIASDTEARAAHSRSVYAASKAERDVHHEACAWCGQSFWAGPSRIHCSRECLEAMKGSGKYRDAFHRRQVEIEAATLMAELNRRMQDGQ